MFGKEDELVVGDGGDALFLLPLFDGLGLDAEQAALGVVAERDLQRERTGDGPGPLCLLLSGHEAENHKDHDDHQQYSQNLSNHFRDYGSYHKHSDHIRRDDDPSGVGSGLGIFAPREDTAVTASDLDFVRHQHRLPVGLPPVVEVLPDAFRFV
jgi:hypothetical protein